MHSLPASFQSVLAEAVRQHRAGRLDAAEQRYRAVLAHQADHADSLHLLGVIAYQNGRNDDAVALITKAIGCNDAVARYHASLGHALCASRRTDEAIASYRVAVSLEPDSPEMHNALGEALRQRGHLADAVAAFRRALGLLPQSAGVLNNLGRALMQQGKLDEASACFREALALKPELPETIFNLGIMLSRQGRLDEAIANFREAIRLRPDLAVAYDELGMALKRQGRLDEAIAAYARAVGAKPDDADAYNKLGNALLLKDRIDEAIANCRRAIELRPDFPDALIALGGALMQSGRQQEAVESYGRAVELRPDDPFALVNLGNAVKQLGRLDEAVAICRKAIDLKPDLAEAHVVMSMAMLAQGDIAAGWEEYEWRWSMPPLSECRRTFEQPQWDGEAAEGRTLLIHAEQGYGDTLQFCRYGPLAAARGLRVVMAVAPHLVRLLRSLPGVDEVLRIDGKLPRFDLHCPMLSLPLAMRTTVASVPSATPYLQAEAADVAAWRMRLATAAAGTGLRVGIAWAGNPRHPTIDRRRSIGAQRLAPLFAVPGVRFFSLQKDWAGAPVASPITDMMGEVRDFADSAALIANLDLVITVDTATVHLAGALGKPVWMLDRFDACWRWLAGRTDSPWYPGLRIYRQPAPGDWDSVVAALVGDLTALAQEVERPEGS